MKREGAVLPKYSTGDRSGTLGFINQAGATALPELGQVPSIRDNMSKLLHASLAAGTWKKYASGWRMFDAYEASLQRKFQWPLSKDVLRGFAVFCIADRKLKPTSVRTYLSSLVCLHRLKGFTTFELKDCLLDAILKGAGTAHDFVESTSEYEEGDDIAAVEAPRPQAKQFRVE